MASASVRPRANAASSGMPLTRSRLALLAPCSLVLVHACVLEHREVRPLTPRTSAHRWGPSTVYGRLSPGVALDLDDGRLDVAVGVPRSGTTIVGVIVPLIPLRRGFRPPRSRLSVLMRLTAGASPFQVDLSATSIRLPDGRRFHAACNPQWKTLSPPLCEEGTISVPAGGTRGFLVEFLVDEETASRLTLEIGGISRQGRGLSIPPIDAERRRYWYYGFPAS